MTFPIVLFYMVVATDLLAYPVDVLETTAQLEQRYQKMFLLLNEDGLKTSTEGLGHF